MKKYIIFLSFFLGVFMSIGFPLSSHAAATGTVYLVYADTTNLGVPKFRVTTSSPDGFITEFNGPSTFAASTTWLVARASPTEDDVMVAQIVKTGRFDVVRCANGCDAAADAILQFTATSSAAQTCDAVTFGSCWKPFDVAYEQLSGQAMVVYASTTNGTLLYRRFDGSAWSPATSSAGTTLTLSGSANVVQWVRLVPRGGEMKDPRTNEILLIAGDGGSDIFTAIWNGSTWTSTTTITTGGSTANAQNFDGAWENGTGDALVVWGDGTTATTTPYRYKKWDRGTNTWDANGSVLRPAQTTATNGVSIGHWVRMASAPQNGTNTIGIMTLSATAQGGATGVAVPWIWTGTTSTKGTEWATIEATFSPILGVAFEANQSSAVKAVFFSSIGSTSDGTGLETWTNATYTGGNADNIAGTTGDMADDAGGLVVTPDPNSRSIHILGRSFTMNMAHNRWNGSSATTTAAGWATGLETVLSPGSASTTQDEGQTEFQVVNPYSPWSRNWRWYDGGDITNTPTTALAGENTSTTDIDATAGEIRLRFNAIELSGVSQIDARKKLQFTTSSDPDSATSTWTDVGNVGSSSIWRYFDCDAGTGICNDGTVVSSTVLTSSTNAGWWNISFNGAASANMDHASATVRELEFPIEANGAATSTTYYFRMYDVDQNTPVFRQQTAFPATPCNGSTCSYPQLTTAADPPSLGLSGNEEYTYGSSSVAISPITVTSTASNQITATDDIRITIQTSTTNYYWDTTDTSATITGSASGKVSSTVSYEDNGATLVVNVTSTFSNGESITISGLSYRDFNGTAAATSTSKRLRWKGASQGTGRAVQSPVGHSQTVTLKGYLQLDNHDAGQEDNKIFGVSSISPADLMSFKIAPVGESATTTGITIDLFDVYGFVNSDITTARLYADMNNNGVVDGGDVSFFSTTGTVSISGNQGTITFTGSYNTTSTRNIILQANLDNIAPADQMRLVVYNTSLSGSGRTSAASIAGVGSHGFASHARQSLGSAASAPVDGLSSVVTTITGGSDAGGSGGADGGGGGGGNQGGGGGGGGGGAAP